MIEVLVHSERVRRLSKEGFWIVIGQAMAVLGFLLGGRLLTELLDPTAYGELALGMTVATLVNQTLLGPLANGVTRYYAPAVEQSDLGGYLRAVRRLMLSATGIIVLVIIFTVVGLLIAGRTALIAIATTALIFAILSGSNSILSGIQNAARQRSIVALHQGMESWARFLFAAGLVLLLGATSVVAMVGYAIAIIPVLGSQYLFFRKIIPKNLAGGDKKINWRKQIWEFSWPYASWGIFSWIQVSSDRWALELFATTRDVGMYAALFQLGCYPISMITGIAVQFFTPIFFQRTGDGRDGRRNHSMNNLSWRLTELTLGLSGAAFVMAYLFHEQIFQIFLAKKYASVSHLLPWMLLSSGVFAAGQTLTLNLASQMKTHKMIAPKIVTALLGLICNIVFSYLYGTNGIVIASIIFSSSYFLWMTALSKYRMIEEYN